MKSIKSIITAALVATTMAATSLASPVEAEAHPLLVLGLAAGAIGALTGAAIASSHPAQIVVERGQTANCVVKQHIGWWGRVHDVEVCR